MKLMLDYWVYSLAIHIQWRWEDFALPQLWDCLQWRIWPSHSLEGWTHAVTQWRAGPENSQSGLGGWGRGGGCYHRGLCRVFDFHQSRSIVHWVPDDGKGSGIAAAATQTGSLHSPVPHISTVKGFRWQGMLALYYEYTASVQSAYTGTFQEELQSQTTHGLVSDTLFLSYLLYAVACRDSNIYCQTKGES